MKNYLSGSVNLSGAPAAGNASTLGNAPAPYFSYDMGGNIQSQLGDAGAITKDYGPADNFSADRSRVEESLYGRLNPQLAKDRSPIRVSATAVRPTPRRWTTITGSRTTPASR